MNTGCNGDCVLLLVLEGRVQDLFVQRLSRGDLCKC